MRPVTWVRGTVQTVRLPAEPAKEAMVVWAATMLALAVAQILGYAIPFVQPVAGALAVAAFLWVPGRVMERRQQDPADAGLRQRTLVTDLAWGLGACLVVLPLFTLAWLHFVKVLPHLPQDLRAMLAPYAVSPHALRWPKLDSDTWGRIAGNGAVALSEEFFYRGYMTLRFEERWPPQFSLWGAKFGKGAVYAAIVFAVGHLLIPAPWRLAVFFPALLFAWLRARTGSIVGAALCHWICNVYLLLLERASF